MIGLAPILSYVALSGLGDRLHLNKKKFLDFLFGIPHNLNKNLTLKKDNLFSFSSLNRFFALSLRRD